MLLEYDGTGFSGWQSQPGQPTIQQTVEETLKISLREIIPVTASGRTDAGVHARGQVAHFRLTESVDTFRLHRSLNGLLPKTIVVRALETVPDDFHARYDASRRRYHYYVSTKPVAIEKHVRWHIRPKPDFILMNRAADSLLGTYDFSSFCRTKSETTNRVCTIFVARWIKENRSGDWFFEIVADRFLHGMVRTIVGTLLQIGRDKRPIDDLPRVLTKLDRREAGPAAPPYGLVLEHVDYPKLTLEYLSV